MGKIPTPTEALEILARYNKDAFHLRHGQIVAGVMGWFAREYAPDEVAFWQTAGMLHDIDFELYPEQHCQKGRELMEAEGLDERLIHAMQAHGYGPCSNVEPENSMEKLLFATDELTGLIGAVALMRPSKSVVDLELKSVKKKFKTPAFAAGCSREIIQRGTDMLGWELDKLIEKTILAMRSLIGTVEGI